MSKLLSDYIFSDTLRYESHRLIYTAEGGPLELTGMLGAAVLVALLVETDEGDARGVAVDTPDQCNAFYLRYEKEMLRDNGGLLLTEIRALSANYIELMAEDGILYRICGNDRLLDLAVGLTVEYMHYLVREEVKDHIYEALPFCEPFAQWLYDAAFVEAYRQHLLAIDWTDAAQVYALAQSYEDANKDKQIEPIFIFDGLGAEQLMNAYFDWLWAELKKQTSVMPDAKEQLALMRPIVLEQEINWDFMLPQISKLSPQNSRFYRKWMEQWKAIITDKMNDSPQASFPEKNTRTKFRQEIFPDDVLPCPPAHNYVAVCDYIRERCRYDKAFNSYYISHSRVQLCDQLSNIFGWIVEPNHLGKRMKSKKM